MLPTNEREYRQYPAVNYSLLKKLSDHPAKVLSEDDTWNDGMLLGDLVDLMCFDREALKERYVSSTNSKPTASLLQLADAVFKEACDHGITVERCAENIESAARLARHLGLWSNIKKEDTLINKFDTDIFWDYLQFKFDNVGKYVVDSDTYFKATQLAQTLKTHEFTKDYFSSNEDHIEIQFQVPYVFEVYINDESTDKRIKVECKALLDILIIDHKNKTVKPVDLKTMHEDTSRFKSTFFYRGYYLQAAHYWLAAHENRPKDYAVLPFEFVVISTQDGFPNPLVWKTTQSTYRFGLFGGTTSKGYDHKGIYQLIEEYLWHHNNNLWAYPYEIYKSKGNVNLEL